MANRDLADKTQRTNYPTQKPEHILHRIISPCSRKDDIALGAFEGSGTTVAVAEKLERRWIAIGSCVKQPGLWMSHLGVETGLMKTRSVGSNYLMKSLTLCLLLVAGTVCADPCDTPSALVGKDATVRDASGRLKVTSSAFGSTTTYRDGSGRITGTASESKSGAVTFRDGSGRINRRS